MVISPPNHIVWVLFMVSLGGFFCVRYFSLAPTDIFIAWLLLFNILHCITQISVFYIYFSYGGRSRLFFGSSWFFFYFYEISVTSDISVSEESLLFRRYLNPALVVDSKRTMLIYLGDYLLHLAVSLHHHIHLSHSQT